MLNLGVLNLGVLDLGVVIIWGGMGIRGGALGVHEAGPIRVTVAALRSIRLSRKKCSASITQIPNRSTPTTDPMIAQPSPPSPP
jgi:hypothetical protein